MKRKGQIGLLLIGVFLIGLSSLLIACGNTQAKKNETKSEEDIKCYIMKGEGEISPEQIIEQGELLFDESSILSRTNEGRTVKFTSEFVKSREGLYTSQFGQNEKEFAKNAMMGGGSKVLGVPHDTKFVLCMDGEVTYAGDFPQSSLLSSFKGYGTYIKDYSEDTIEIYEVIRMGEAKEDLIGAMDAEINKKAELEPGLQFNSSPYPYIENNEYYESLIREGVGLLPTLEQTLIDAEKEGNSGLSAYIMALVMERVSKIEVNQVLFGTEEKSWGGSGEFLDQWLQVKKETNERVTEILNSQQPNEATIKEIQKFGVLAIPAIADFTKQNKAATALIESLESYVETFGLDESEKSAIIYVLK